MVMTRYAAYHKHNLGWGGPWDRLGYIISTLSIGGVHIGVHLVSFYIVFFCRPAD